MCATFYRFPQLDVLVTPLVAFDEDGQRLGMGGGFYDRTLQNWPSHWPDTGWLMRTIASASKTTG
ncbi:putative ligase [Salmonella enterica subsp. arizonae]|uniref:Putative ligase n=1 Tax=Salmonella enterica subsp. arizonae TaxID=59203 RepID=A0A379RZC1_SALER|nr:putative ligase [Salmonella enterica subsp. arizonae]